jgi:HK97 family phage major capsid protein
VSEPKKRVKKMSKILELREKQAQLATNARAELDKITDKTEESRAKEIEASFDAMMSDYDKLGDQIDREERAAKALESRRPVQASEAEAAAQASQKTPEYKEVFEKQLRFGGASLCAEERAVLMTGRAESRAQSTGTDSAGGYTVPEGFSGNIEKTMADWGPMYDGTIVTDLRTTSGNPIPWPTVDDTAKRGRIKAENAAADDDGTDDVTFAEKVLNAYMYDTGIVRIPMELLQDSYFNMEALLTELFGERMGRTANQVLTTGTGSSQPNGIVTASALGKTAASATAITSDELIDLQHSVNAAYRRSPKCRWMFADTTLQAIRKLKDGQGNYLWTMGDVRSASPDLFLGKPYSINDDMATIATGNKTVLFGDMSKYVVRKVNNFSVLTLRERYAEFFQVGMVGHARFDGELLNTAAVKHLIQA